jgi:predicted RNA-binding protein associated with RNAse of E/G family
MWTEGWDFRCWYVQLQDPILETPTGLETMDHALDVVVEPDGSWEWKDEDDFAELQRLGAFTPSQAAAVRAEGQRVIAAHPWPTGWEHWRP